jgi:hypothetical protein
VWSESGVRLAVCGGIRGDFSEPERAASDDWLPRFVTPDQRALNVVSGHS